MSIQANRQEKYVITPYPRCKVYTEHMIYAAFLCAFRAHDAMRKVDGPSRSVILLICIVRDDLPLEDKISVREDIRF